MFISVDPIIFSRWSEGVICDPYLLDCSWSGAQVKIKLSGKEETQKRHSYCSGTVSLHPGFTGRPGYGGIFSDSQGWLRDHPLKNFGTKLLSLMSFTSQAWPLPIFPHCGNFPGSRVGLAGFLEVLIGTLLWMASNIPGVSSWMQSEKPWWGRPWV